MCVFTFLKEKKNNKRVLIYTFVGIFDETLLTTYNDMRDREKKRKRVDGYMGGFKCECNRKSKKSFHLM